MSRIGQRFTDLAARRAGGLVAYVTAGDPNPAISLAVATAVAEAGADVIELGVPFSDPVADGPVIQRAAERALAAGANLGATVRMAAALRRQGVETPLVLFTYVNPVLQMGVVRFAGEAAAAGIDGVLIVDVPIEEADSLHTELGRHALDQIFLVSPTTADARLARVAALSDGFVYAISRLGVTGSRPALSDTAAPLVRRVRAVTSLPVALGFGVSRPEHVRAVWGLADAAVVGSALVEACHEAFAAGADAAGRAGAFVRWLREAGSIESESGDTVRERGR